ncbi:MAG: membrane protein insertase YidC [Actinobacteria bacterium]|nr:membrane protein insertase YidC [Actinomycetota bacterium]
MLFFAAAKAQGGSTLGRIFEPVFHLFAVLIAFFYSVVPNYAVAIALLTLAVMVVLTPLTVKQTRAMVATQRIQPHIQKLREKHKDDKQKLNEEMMKLYKEHNVPLSGGCLLLLLQWPVFFILYDVIRGLTNMTPGKHPVPAPRYIGHNTTLYKALIKSDGKIMAFGLNLSKSALSHHSSVLTALPYFLILGISIALGYVQMNQVNRRSMALGSSSPQMQQMQKMQKYMPIMFGIIYVFISAVLNVYFVVSSAYRILVQEIMFRFDPAMRLGPIIPAVITGEDAKPAGAKPTSPSGARPAVSSGGTRSNPGSGAGSAQRRARANQQGSRQKAPTTTPSTVAQAKSVTTKKPSSQAARPAKDSDSAPSVEAPPQSKIQGHTRSRDKRPRRVR